MSQFMPWLRIAKITGRGLAQTMRETTHREYLLWVESFEQEWNHPTKQDWYLAQIAREVACVLASTEEKKSRPVKDFLLKFTIPKSSEEKKSSSEEKWKQSKEIWKQVTSFATTKRKKK
jgi:hypothetical protein